MEILMVIGRIIFGFAHGRGNIQRRLSSNDAIDEAAQSGVGLPAKAKDKMMLSKIRGVVHAIVGLAIILGVWTDLALLLAGLFWVQQVFYNFPLRHGEESRSERYNLFNKATLIAAGVIFMLGATAALGTGDNGIGWTLTDNLFWNN